MMSLEAGLYKDDCPVKAGPSMLGWGSWDAVQELQKSPKGSKN